MGRSRTRKLRPRAPLFPFATASGSSNTMNLNDSMKSPPLGPIGGVVHPNDIHDSDNSDSFKSDTEGSQKNNETVDLLAGTSKEEETVTTTTSTNTLVTEQNDDVEDFSKMTHHDSMCFLKIIGSIQSGQKLSHTSNNPNQPFSIDPNKWSSSISRWWNGDSRTVTVKTLRRRFDAVFTNIDESYQQHTNKRITKKDAFNRSPKDILMDYARELSGAEKGLRHLCHTYKSDVPIASELQVMLESVTIRKQTIDNMFTIKDTK